MADLIVLIFPEAYSRLVNFRSSCPFRHSHSNKSWSLEIAGKLMEVTIKTNNYHSPNSNIHYSPLYMMPIQMQSVPITTDFVSSNLDRGKVYNIM